MGAAKDYKPHYTFDDYRHWEGRWELIEGEAFAMSPAPLPRHQRISARIARLLEEALERCTQCASYLPIDWHIAEDTIVQPDHLVLCYEPEGSYITKAPSLVFEIVSTSTAAKDEHLKYALYEREGVLYYVLVYPDEERVKIYRLLDGRYTKALDGSDETFAFELDPCTPEIDLKRIWPPQR
jgi:Uma2 family endonuclease